MTKLHAGLLVTSIVCAFLLREKNISKYNSVIHNAPIIKDKGFMDRDLQFFTTTETTEITEKKDEGTLTGRIIGAQLLFYLKMSDYRIGLLINFNTKLLKDSIRRMKS